MDQPTDANDVKRWLRSYWSWRFDLQSMGYYNVPPDLGTKIQSNRTGRPTETTALQLMEVSAKVRTVEGWLRKLCRIERAAVDWYLDGTMTIQQIADAQDMKFHEMRAIIDAIPYTVWSREFESQ